MLRSAKFRSLEIMHSWLVFEVEIELDVIVIVTSKSNIEIENYLLMSMEV